MKKILTMAFAFLVSVGVLIAGDSLETVFIAKSDKELDEKAVKLFETLPPSVSASFKEAIFQITTDYALNNAFSSDDKKKDLWPELDGLTVGQIIEKGQKIHDKNEKEKKETIRKNPKNFPKSADNPEGYEKK